MWTEVLSHDGTRRTYKELAMSEVVKAVCALLQVAAKDGWGVTARLIVLFTGLTVCVAAVLVVSAR
jgi:hypothetical protein